jgi:hypothetical protein
MYFLLILRSGYVFILRVYPRDSKKTLFPCDFLFVKQNMANTNPTLKCCGFPHNNLLNYYCIQLHVFYFLKKSTTTHGEFNLYL